MFCELAPPFHRPSPGGEGCSCSIFCNHQLQYGSSCDDSVQNVYGCTDSVHCNVQDDELAGTWEVLSRDEGSGEPLLERRDVWGMSDLQPPSPVRFS